MRTKALLGLAVLTASAVTSMAQVYSLNIVGYVNQPVAATKYYLLENPLTKGTAPGANAITNVITGLNDTFGQSVLYTYENGALVAAETYFAGFGWFPGTTELTPGKAFYLYPTAAGTVTFVGEVVLTNTISLKPGYNMVGSAYPANLELATLGLTGQNTAVSDIVYRYASDTGVFNPITYFNGYGWFDSGFPGGTGGDPKGPKLNVGEGVWYYNANPAAIDWKQAFTVQ